jgi:RNA polymerase sigma-70 factor (ECF subfamily)
MAANVTILLQQWSRGNEGAIEQLFPLVYDELRKLAGGYLRRERQDHTLQSTALVHEAFLRMVDQQAVEWQSRAHFFGIAARIIRQILVDHARARRAQKRGGDALTLPLDEALAVPERKNVDLVALDDALTELARLDERQAKVVELRFFAGLSIEETAAALRTSAATVKRDWAVAKAWLLRELDRAGGAAAE